MEEREHWDAYMDAYEDVHRRHQHAPHAPWYVIPADHKWFMRLAVAEIIVKHLEDLGLQYPEVDAHKKDEVAQARALLESEGQAQAPAKRGGERKKKKP